MKPKITIQPEQVYSLGLKGHEIVSIYTLLLEQPYNKVAPLIANIEQMISEQTKIIEETK